MRIDQTISLIISRVLGRVVRRGTAAALMAIFVLAAIYQLTAAGALGLADHFGLINARLIIAAIYVVLAAGLFGLLYVTRAKPLSLKERSGVSRTPKDVQLAMLIESLLVGYLTERGKSRQP